MSPIIVDYRRIDKAKQSPNDYPCHAYRWYECEYAFKKFVRRESLIKTIIKEMEKPTDNPWIPIKPPTQYEIEMVKRMPNATRTKDKSCQET